jgi:hypothetical protein
VAGPLERALRTLDGGRQGTLEAHEAGAGRAFGAEGEQRVLGRLDLLGAVQLGISAERGVHHRLAEVDELAAQPRVVDRPSVFAGIDDADHGGEKLGEIGGAADFLQHARMLELGLQHHGVGELSCLDAAHNGLVDAAVDRVREVVRREELGDSLVRLVVGEQGAEQGLLGLQVGRGQALGEPEQRRVDGVQDQTSIGTLARQWLMRAPSRSVARRGESRFGIPLSS